MIDVKALGALAAANGADQTKSVVGGVDFVPPAAGPGFARFVGYIELGKQKGSFKGVPNVKEKVNLIFELVGKRHPPNETADGKKLPHLIVIDENYSLNEKANFFKLFQRMNYKQDAVHIAQLLGAGFKVEVVHEKWTDKTNKERVSAVLRTASGPTIAPPRKEDEDSETGWVDVVVPPALSEIRCFLWQHADLAQWASLFIEGEYPERKDDKGAVTAPARSKNVYQNKIKSAVNFPGSSVEAMLLSGGQGVDVPDVGEEEQDPAAGQSGEPAEAAPKSGVDNTQAPDALTDIV